MLTVMVRVLRNKVRLMVEVSIRIQVGADT